MRIASKVHSLFLTVGKLLHQLLIPGHRGIPVFEGVQVRNIPFSRLESGTGDVKAQS
jgi:hypothetical protein